MIGGGKMTQRVDTNMIGLSTIEEFIEYGKSMTISNSTLFYKKNLNGTIINWDFILDDYFDVLRKFISRKILTKEEYFRYRYKPKTLSVDLYGTTELAYPILRINNLSSAIEFDLGKPLVFDEGITEVIKEIFILERSKIVANKVEINT